MPHGPEEEEEENSYDGLSPGEELAREFESRQKAYFDSVTLRIQEGGRIGS